MSMHHRTIASSLLTGYGLEIGALHNPFSVPQNCSVQYLDVATKDTLAGLFPGLSPGLIVEPSYIGDIGQNSVVEITGRQFDFVIANHILEHVANPIKALKNIWDGINYNGLLVLGIPDKLYTFDVKRELTSFNHILADYYLDAVEGDNSHYVDLLEHVQLQAFASRETFIASLISAKQRREHIHVWDSESFRSHLGKIFELFNIDYTVVFQSDGRDNLLECFSVIRKGINANIPDIKPSPPASSCTTGPKVQVRRRVKR